MRRRRQVGTVQGNIFDAAHTSIRSKELDVFYATVEATFTMDDMVNWLFPEDTIRKLKDAYPLATPSYHTNFTVTLPLPSGMKVNLNMDLDTVHMQCPIKTLVDAKDHTRGKPIIDTLEAIVAVHASFNKVRSVIDWFGMHSVTAGAAAYYWPTILTLLPLSHPVHEVTGQRYREVTGIGEIVPLLRETAGIVAGAIMCPSNSPPAIRGTLSVQCLSTHPQSFTVL